MGIQGCDGVMWRKPPGESDGQAWSPELNMNAPAPGVFWDTYAYNDNAADFQAPVRGLLQDVPAMNLATTGGNGTVVTPPAVGGGGSVGATSASWYARGTQPSSYTLAQRVTMYLNHFDEAESYMITTSGTPASGMRRCKVPDLASAGGDTSVQNGTFSEGQGYWAIQYAYRARPGGPIYSSTAETRLAEILTYSKYYRDSNGVPNWRINASGTATGFGGATDGDQDLLHALDRMKKFKPTGGVLDWVAEHAALRDAIKNYEYTPGTNIQMNGDLWGRESNQAMSDYFDPELLGEEAAYNSDNSWNDKINVNYPFLQDYFYNNYKTGLVPDQCNRQSGSLGYAYGNGYNAIRNPFRQIRHYLNNNDPRAQRMMLALSQFIRGKCCDVAANARAEWNLPGTSSANYINQAFLSGYALAAIADPSSNAFLNSALAWLDADTEQNYFGNNLRLLALLVFTGEMKPYR